MSSPLLIPAPIELIILSIWTNGREREVIRETYSVCKGKSFPSNKANPCFWIQVSQNMIITPAGTLNVSHSHLRIEKPWRSGGWIRCVSRKHKDRAEMKEEEDWIGGSYSCIISVCLLAVDWSSPTVNRPLITELYNLHIHPTVKTVGSSRVTQTWPI